MNGIQTSIAQGRRSRRQTGVFHDARTQVSRNSPERRRIRGKEGFLFIPGDAEVWEMSIYPRIVDIGCVQYNEDGQSSHVFVVRASLG